MKHYQQLFPILLTIITFILLSLLLYFFINLLNIFPAHQKIELVFLPIDILVGMTIYTKTSIDFALFIGNLMHTNSGWKNRVAIEIGTALGNGLGTILVLFIWFFFKEVPILMAMMIIIASLVLLRMAQDGLEEIISTNKSNPLYPLYPLLLNINSFSKPFLSRLLPESRVTKTKPLPFLRLLSFSLTIPFILGLDDFAGYIPIFTIINVFSFIIGVLLAHMLLNIGLFAFPDKTTQITKYPFVIISGSLIFILLALIGFYDVTQILISFF